MNYVIAYFLVGFCVFVFTFYRFVESGMLEKMLEGGGVGRFGGFIMASVVMHFLLWPLHVAMTTIQYLSPGASEAAFKAFRRQFVDRDRRFTQPQMPAMCGSYKMEPPTSEGRSPALSMCVRAANHDGKHSNRDARVPHDDQLCPCEPREWTDEESVCMHTYVRMCTKHGGHEGKCRTPEGEEFEPMTSGV